jgi:hypothetical protein
MLLGFRPIAFPGEFGIHVIFLGVTYAWAKKSPYMKIIRLCLALPDFWDGNTFFNSPVTHKDGNVVRGTNPWKKEAVPKP